MKQRFVKVSLAVAALAALVLPVAAQQKDPFYREPKKKAKVVEERDTNKPVLVPFPSFEQRSQEYLQARQVARSSGAAEPEPIGQYLVNEVTVTGVFQTDRGPGAFVQAGPSKTTFYVYTGTRLYNGEIVAINTGSDFNLGQVVFREMTKYRIKKKEIEQVNTVTKSVGAPGAGRRR
jgi:hypothetical protein